MSKSMYQGMLDFCTNNKYTFIKYMDGGGLGDVFLAQNRDTDSLVIITKIYLKDYNYRKEDPLIQKNLYDMQLQSIKKDIYDMKLIKHSNIVEFIESFSIKTTETSTSILLVFTYHENTKTLLEYIDSKEQFDENENELKNIFNGMVHALDHLHSLGIIHGHITFNDFIIVSKADGTIVVKLIPIKMIKYIDLHVPYDDLAPEINIHNAIYTKASNCWDLGFILSLMIFKYNTYDKSLEQLNLYRKTRWDALSRSLQKIIGGLPNPRTQNPCPHAIPNSLLDTNPITRITTWGIMSHGWIRDNWGYRCNFAVFNSALSKVLNVILLKNSCETTCENSDKTTCENSKYKHAEIIFFHLRFDKHISLFL